MSRRIKGDHKDYHDIVKDKVKSKLKDHITKGKKVVRRGKDMVVVDIPYIELPRFRYGNQDGGIGNGPADVGDEVGDGPPQPGGEQGQPGNDTGEHDVGVGVSLDFYLDMLAEELELPNMEPKQNSEITNPHIKWNRTSSQGNNSLLHKKKTFKQAIKRVVSEGNYDPEDITNVYPVKDDKVYKSWSQVDKPDANAVIFFMSDISASMGPDKRDLIRELCWYLETWISRFYEETQMKYIVHDSQAYEVDKEKFYKYTSGGGTRISSAFELVKDVIERAYPLDEWNIYIFYLSDGENFGDDNRLCADYLKDLQEMANLIGITEVKAMRSWAEFLPFIQDKLNTGKLSKKKITTTSMDKSEDILKSLKKLVTIEESI